MLEQIKSLRSDTLVYELDNFISDEEIKYIEIGIETLLKDFEKINLMIYVNVSSENFRAFAEEFKLVIKFWDKLNKVVYVSEKKHWKTLVAIDNIFTKFEEKYFDISNINKAWDWLNKD